MITIFSDYSGVFDDDGDQVSGSITKSAGFWILQADLFVSRASRRARV